MYKQVISKHIVEYLKKRKYNHTNRGNLLLDCPDCRPVPLTANLIPNTSILKCLKCNKTFTLIDLYRIVEQTPDLSEEDVFQGIKELLKIDVQTKTDDNKLEDTLLFYKEKGFNFLAVHKEFDKEGVPTAKCKRPVQRNWQITEHKNLEEVKDWIINANLNLGLNTGSISGITVLDLDVLSKDEKKEYDLKDTSNIRKKELLAKRQKKLDELFPKLNKIAEEDITNTLTQDTLGGQHLLFKYEPELPKSALTIEGVNIDLENERGYILIAPSVCHDYTRSWKNKDIIKMPVKLLEYLKANTKKNKKPDSEVIKDAIKTENFKVNPKDLELKGNNLQGTCNSSFIALGGILRKQLNTSDTGFVLNVLNKHMLEHPMESQAIQAMVQQLDYYIEFDEEDLTKEIIKYLKDVKKSTKSDLELAIAGDWTKGEKKKRFNKALQYLIKEEKIKQYKNTIEIIEDMEWSDTLIDVGIPVNFKVPYFHEYAYFNWGDVIVIASKTQYGKTCLSVNILERIVAQNIKPYYLYSESGGRFSKIALHRGLSEGQFYHAFIGDSRKIILPKKQNIVVVYDWLRPHDFAKTDSIFNELVEKTKRVNGLMIIFMQLKDNEEYFAQNLLSQYPTLVAKYLYENDSDGTFTKFHITKVREGKLQGKYFDIPSVYNWKTKQVKMVSELTEEEKKQFVKKVDVTKLPSKINKCSCGKELKNSKYKRCWECNQKDK